MTFNISLELEQSQREQNDLAAVENQIESIGNIYTDGNFDGVTGHRPNRELWCSHAYRSGYLAGLTRYYDKKYQTVLKDEPF
ncbi:MAG: hypothetical protein ACRC80_25850 [Waterburya sp.]